MGATTWQGSGNRTSTLQNYMGWSNNGSDLRLNGTITSGTITQNTWHHVAWVRESGGAMFMYLDGVKGNQVVDSGGNNIWGTGVPMNTSTRNTLSIGARAGTTSEMFVGNMDEFRYSSTARYTASFTPETSAFTPDASTEVLLHFNADPFIDESILAEAFSATGTALGTTNVPTSAVTDVSGVMLLKNASGTNTLGTDVKVYFTANNSAWTEAASYADAGTFSTGIKMIKLGKTTVASGSDVRWKVVFANQADGSKEAQIYGMGVNY